MSNPVSETGQESPHNRWWLTSLITAVIAMAAAIAVLYLPAKWSWILVLGLVVFAVTYRLHPALWYRRRAEAAFAVAGISTLAPGLEAVVQWGPDTVAGVIIKTGWPAIVLPWVTGMWFGWLDYLSRRKTAPTPIANPSETGATVKQKQTGVAGGITANTVNVNIHQTQAGTGEAPMSPPAPQVSSSKPNETSVSEQTSVTKAKAIADSKLLRHSAQQLVGRGKELGQLTRAWKDKNTHVVSIVAWGGVGKTALTVEWMARFAELNWEGVDSYFDWSFYSQGTRDQDAASADTFVAEALRHFGDAEMGDSSASAWDKGIRLAKLVAERKSLLILDGLEPLQYLAGKAGLDGRLKDLAIEALLKSLAQKPMQGLCILTTREPVSDLKAFHGKTVSEWRLEHLSEEAGAELLHRAGAKRAGAAEIKSDDKELRATSREMNGHALTLQLLGSYLGLAHVGDIRRRDMVDFQEADAEVQGGHAFRVIEAYERWLAQAGENGVRELAVLRLLGLFDRPADPGCLAALRRQPAIAGLTEPLTDLSDAQWNTTITRLADLDLIALDAKDSALRTPHYGFVDAHPLIREYFRKQLQDGQDDVRQAAHRRLYEHLCAGTEHRPDTLDGLQPLYQAVSHGCQAGLHQQACQDVYRDRILRGIGRNNYYSSKKLGANGADLGAVACFFDRPWSRLSPKLSETFQAWLLSEAANRLRLLGRLDEAAEPMNASLKKYERQNNWYDASMVAVSLSELELALGEVSAAIADGEQSVTFADRTGHAFDRAVNRATHADCLHQAGRRGESLGVFRAAEAIQAESEHEHPRLYSVWGYGYCDLLLSDAERAAWRVVIGQAMPDGNGPVSQTHLDLLKTCDEGAERAAQALELAIKVAVDLLSPSLDHLTLGRAALYKAILHSHSAFDASRDHLTAAVDGLRQSGSMDNLPLGFLTRAWLRHVTGDESAARDDLNEAWEIAERGPMRLHMADVLLTRARLFRDKAALEAARGLIKQCGYHRRDEELADAEQAAQTW